MDAATIDAMAREERIAEPGAEIPVVLQPGEAIGNKVLFGSNVEVPQTLINALNTLSGLARPDDYGHVFSSAGRRG